MYVCIYVYSMFASYVGVHLYRCTHCVYPYRGQRRTSGVPSITLYLISFHGVFTELKLAILTMLADQNALWIFLSLPPVPG